MQIRRKQIWRGHARQANRRGEKTNFVNFFVESGGEGEPRRFNALSQAASNFGRRSARDRTIRDHHRKNVVDQANWNRPRSLSVAFLSNIAAERNQPLRKPPQLSPRTRQEGPTVFVHVTVPTNDGVVALLFFAIAFRPTRAAFSRHRRNREPVVEVSDTVAMRTRELLDVHGGDAFRWEVSLVSYMMQV